MARLFSRIIVACGAMWIAVTSAHAGDDHFAPIGSEFMANQYTPYTQGQPTVAMDHDGNFVVAFSNLGTSGRACSGLTARLAPTTSG
jgi:hypothetical protein